MVVVVVEVGSSESTGVDYTIVCFRRAGKHPDICRDVGACCVLRGCVMRTTN